MHLSHLTHLERKVNAMRAKARDDQESPLPEPRDLHQELISAPLVTTFGLQALIDSPQFQQKIVLASGYQTSLGNCSVEPGILQLGL